ncbi:MAG: hypothetical protein AAF197_03405 [Pseudomonadota bacterium]
MKLLRRVGWDSDVYPSWQKAMHYQVEPSSVIWQDIPESTNWWLAIIEPEDIDFLYAIGSADWRKIFGSFRITEIQRRFEDLQEVEHLPDDPFEHVERIKTLARLDLEETNFEPLIMVCGSEHGSMMAIDGNHRMIAYLVNQQLVDKSVYLGIHESIPLHYEWYRYAVYDEKTNTQT